MGALPHGSHPWGYELGRRAVPRSSAPLKPSSAPPPRPLSQEGGRAAPCWQVSAGSSRLQATGYISALPGAQVGTAKGRVHQARSARSQSARLRPVLSLGGSAHHTQSLNMGTLLPAAPVLGNGLGPGNRSQCCPGVWVQGCWCCSTRLLERPAGPRAHGKATPHPPCQARHPRGQGSSFHTRGP